MSKTISKSPKRKIVFSKDSGKVKKSTIRKAVQEVKKEREKDKDK